jgi:hypothetical protein
MVYLKFQIEWMQERELRALKREKKMSREGKIKRKVCVWKRKKERKNRKIKKEKKYVYERKKKRKEE